MYWSDYYEIFKDQETYYVDFEYNDPIIIASANVGPRTMITRSMSRKFEKNEILKKVFYKQFNRYPLRNRLDDSSEWTPNYYESEDSDTELKRRRRVKRRRHSIGAILQTARVDNPINEPKIICIFCHVQKLLKLGESKPMAELIKKLRQSRKSMSNVEEKRKHPVSRISQSEENIFQSRYVERSYEDKSKSALERACNKQHQRRKSDSHILFMRNREMSIEKHTSELEGNEMSGSTRWEDLSIPERTRSKKIFHRRRSEGGYKKVESDEKTEAKPLNENKAENTADKKVTKKINQRRKSEPNILRLPYFASSPAAKAKAESKESLLEMSYGNCYNTGEEIVTKKLNQRRKSEASIIHIKNRDNFSENVISKPVANKTAQSKCLPDTTELKSKKIVQRRSSSRTNQKKPADHSSKKETSTNTSTKKSEINLISQKGHTERQTNTKEKHSSGRSEKFEIKNFLKSGKRKSVDKVINVEPKKTSQKPSGSESSHKIEKAVSKNVDTKRPSVNELKDSKGKRNERSSTSRERKENQFAGRRENAKNSDIRHSESDCIHQKEKGVEDCRKRRSSGSSRSKEREHSINAKTQSKQEHGEKKRRSSETSTVSSEVTNLSKKRQSEGETSYAEKEYLKDAKKSSENKHRELHKKVDKDTKCATEKLHKDRKANTENTPERKCSVINRLEDMRQSSVRDTNMLPPKRVSFGIKRNSSLSPLCNIHERRKSDSETLKTSNSLKMQASKKKQKISCEDNYLNSLMVSIEKDRLHEGTEENSDFNLNEERAQIVSKPGSSKDAEICENDKPSPALQRKRTFNLNISSAAAGEEVSKLPHVITLVPSNEESQADGNLLTVEDQLKKIFHDTIDSEIATEELIQILSTSSENLDAAFERSLISDAVQMCLESHSAEQGTSSQVIRVVDNCGKHFRHISEARNIRESRRTDTAQKPTVERRSDGVPSDMTKMEHYKKRLIQQHEKPSLIPSPRPASEEEYDSPPPSPIIASQNNHRERKKEDIVHSKVARKRAVCRSQFRHQNLELFKLGSSIPTSLCKTKEPYNVCTEKNLQLCSSYQNQNGKKSEENVKESITESIINTMEGNKKKDILWRSVSLNDKYENPNKPSNIIENSQNNSGRHNLPAIVPEIPDRRKTKTPNPRENKTGSDEKAEKGCIRVETDFVIRKADPISINKRKSVVKRRKTAIGIEGSETESRNVDGESVSDPFDIPNRETDSESALGRRKSITTESTMSENSPINLSVKNKEQSSRLEIIPIKTSNDPRLYSKQSHYMRQILPNQCNTLPKPTASSVQNHEPTRVFEQHMPSSSTTQNDEPPRSYVSEQSTPRSENREPALIYTPVLNTQPTPCRQNHELATNYFAGPSNLPSSSIQHHEPAKNYITALPKPSHNHEPAGHGIAGLTMLSPLAKSYQPARDNAAGSIHKTSTNMFQSREPARSYFPVPCTSSNAPMPYYQNSFPEIQQQINRLDNVTLPVQNRPVNPPAINNEEVIKTIIQLVKSSMDPNFSIEILLILNRWYIELKLLGTHQNVPKKIKASITRTLNDVIFYISEKLFGAPCNAQLKSYIEQIIQVIAPHHKDLLTSLLPLLKINYNNDQWMSSVIKLLSQSLLPLDPRNQVNVPHNPPHNPIYNVPVSNHNFSHVPQTPVPVSNHNFSHVPQTPAMPQQNYFYQNLRPPPPPYQGYTYQQSAPVNGNYMLNMDQIHRTGMLMSYPPNHLNAAAMEVQRNQQNIPTYQNATQNFQRQGSYNPLPVATLVRPEMYLSDNRCVPPKYGPAPNPEQGPQHLPVQNKPTKSKSKKKDRLDIIPIIPANTTITAVLNNNIENQNCKVTNDQSSEPMEKAVKKQKKTNASSQKTLISPQSLEISTTNSNNEAQRPAPDVEELLQTNFIYNNGRTANNENTSITMNKTPVLNTSTIEENAGEITDENIVNVTSNFDNHLPKEELKTEIPGNTKENHHAVASTVIVQDKSMEITRGSSNENSTATESTDDKTNLLSNDIILEKVPSETSDEVPENKHVIKQELKVELFDLTTKMKELYGGDTAEVKLQIIKEVFGDNEDYLQYLLSQRAKKKALMNSDEVIMIDDDEDISIEKVEEMPKAPDDGPPKLIKLLPMKRKENESGRKHREKKLRTGMSVPSHTTGNEIINLDEEEKENSNTNIEDIYNNSDCNQNYLSVIDDVTKNEELLNDPLTEDPNSASATPGADISTDKTPATPKMSVVVTNDTEKNSSPIVDQQMSTEVIEAPAIEDISDEETIDEFCLGSRYAKDLSGNPLDTLENFEVSHCNIINGTINTIQHASNRDFFEKPLVYTHPVTTKRKKSEKSAEALTEELQSAIAGRKWSCLASITHFDEDSSSTMSLVSVQHAWDMNYVVPKPGRHYPASPAYHTSIESVSPVSSSLYLEDRYSKESPRISPNFRSPSRSVPTSPVCPSPSLAATPSPVASTTTPIIPPLNNRVNWENWFAEEKRKGFFNFDRSQSVESESAGRRRSVDTASSTSSDYCSRIPTEENYCEVKIDNKMYRIRRTLYDKIPKGKLCYIRENNSFIRYFDDNQMELFIRNLNIGDGCAVASDLLKQIKGRVEGITDVETSLGHYEASGKSEVIIMPKDVCLSTADNLSDPELYVEEVEKVQRFIPRDFYGFYKYVTGYQIVNHHTPISFQTFLAMHNTNGIKGLFKSYINTLIEGHAVL